MKVTNGLLNSVPTIVSSGKPRSSTLSSTSTKIPTHAAKPHHINHHPVEIQTNPHHVITNPATMTTNIVSSNLASNLNEDDFIGSASEFIKGKSRSQNFFGIFATQIGICHLI